MCMTLIIASASPFLVLSLLSSRAEEEAAARVKLEKEKRELLAQLQETQDDLESEREGRARAEKQRRQLNEELESLRDSLEVSESSTVAQQEIRTQRENELAQFKKQLEDETANHESTVASMRSKNNKAMEDLNDQLEAAKKVSNVTASLFLGMC